MNAEMQKLLLIGQSLWYDNIQRRLIENGGLGMMISNGEIRGITSNPSIFLNAFSKTKDYDAALVPMAWSGWEKEKIFWQLAVEDIRNACELFSDLYNTSKGADGYVSLEVNPALAHDVDGTCKQARLLWEWVARPNLMVKIPATLEGIPAIRTSIAAGINVNATLIFSLDRYHAVMDAYLSGIEDRLAAGLDIHKIASVASFFVSRMDTKVDALLDSINSAEAMALRGKTAIAYTRLAYVEFLKVFQGERFNRLKAFGCSTQRPLWASTSTKNPAYPDTMYVDDLIGPGIINTVPPQTLNAFKDHGKAEVTILDNLDEARKTLAILDSLGISMNKVTRELEIEGVDSFSHAFAAILDAIEIKRSAAVSLLGNLSVPVTHRIAGLIESAASSRLWSHDPSLWSSDSVAQEEIRRRLGWLELPRRSEIVLKEITDFISQVRANNLNHILLLGMGGSSLAPEMISIVSSRIAKLEHGESEAGYTFSILDSTDPVQVLETSNQFPPEETLYIVSSKSGGTAEVNALFSYFWEQSGQKGDHFVAITDPGTTLAALANARGFRKTFLADPNVGGRYSALSHFGLVPAGLMGLDAKRMLEKARWMMSQCSADVSGARNPGLTLGAVLGQAALDGRDKLTFLADETVAPLGAWIEQLITESSGKQGKGIIVVDGEPETEPAGYSHDRIFVYLRREGHLDATVERLHQAGHPVLVFEISDIYDLGSEFYRWEVATAFACVILGVNAFDQPDVQDSKNRTMNKLDAYNLTGFLDEGEIIWEKDGIRAYSNMPLVGSSLQESLEYLLGIASRDAGKKYIAINAFIPRNSENSAKLTDLRLSIREKTHCATTVGFGPRFLHSTGQLHKGGPDSGLFLQITSDPVRDVQIPGQNMSFGVLEHCQALGDYEALVACGRCVLRLHLQSLELLADIVSVVKR